MKQIVLLVIASAIVASVQSMDLTRPSLVHQSMEHHEPQVAVDYYPTEHVRYVQRKEVQTDATEGHVENGEHSRLARSPKEPVSGRVVVEGGARRGSSTGGKTEGNIYVGGQVRFRRSAEEQEQPTENNVAEQQFEAVEQVSVLPRRPLNVRIIAADEIYEGDVPTGTETRFRRSPEPKRRHRTNVDISVDKKIYDGKRGSISIGGGASKRPGERWDPHVGVSGSIRF